MSIIDECDINIVDHSPSEQGDKMVTKLTMPNGLTIDVLPIYSIIFHIDAEQNYPWFCRYKTQWPPLEVLLELLKKRAFLEIFKDLEIEVPNEETIRNNLKDRDDYYLVVDRVFSFEDTIKIVSLEETFSRK